MRTTDLYPEAWLAMMLAPAALVGVIVALTVLLAAPAAARPRPPRALHLIEVPHVWVCPFTPGGRLVVNADVCVGLNGIPLRRG